MFANYIKKIKSINALFLNVQQFPLNPYNHATQKPGNLSKQSITLLTSDTEKIFHEFYYKILIFNQVKIILVSNFILKSDYLVFNRQEMIFF